MSPKNETEIGRVVVAWLTDWGWEVYQEVQCSAYGAIADIVATRGALCWVIECKASLGLGVLEQALAWRGQAHYVSVATAPWGVRARTRRVMDIVFAESGIGWLGVSVNDGLGSVKPEVRELVPPRLYRRAGAALLRRGLTEAHKTYAAAGSQGGYLTAFRASCDRIAAWVAEHPGVSMKEMIESMGRLHYNTTATARSAMAKWIQAGAVRGVRCERAGRALALYPDREAAQAPQVSP